jgi:formate hydrogenlyase transcriptional activator
MHQFPLAARPVANLAIYREWSRLTPYDPNHREARALDLPSSMAEPLTPAEEALVASALSLADRLDVQGTCDAILDAVERVFGARASWILLHDPTSDRLVTTRFRGPGADSYAGLTVPCDRGIVGLAFTRGETVFVPDAQNEDRWIDPDRVHHSELRSVFTVPLVHDDTRMGVVGLDSPRFSAEAPPGPTDLALLRAIAALAAIGIKNARLFQDVEEDRVRLRRLLQDRRQLRTEVGHLREEVRSAHAFSKVVGESTATQEVLSQVDVVAPADSTVLLVGETGTGKELIARAIHERSRRASSPFVAVNCAALPEALVESELFGHEKGAFTGALARKPGKFELADRGTLFLDEIGDLPPEAQAKLLRVLQEREVQRVGGTRPVPVNVRLIAATNQDLEECMRTGRFRQDLFYRLSVFPVRLPPLRERPEDIPPLVSHFVRRFAERQHKAVPHVSREAMEQLTAYDWPGNVRELQNIIERAVILSRGGVIGCDLVPVRSGLRSAASTPPAALPRTEVRPPGSGTPVVAFSEAERRAILRALDLTGWRISGRGGAADVLGLKPTTLHAKMKKLGIHRPSVHQAS